MLLVFQPQFILFVNLKTNNKQYPNKIWSKSNCLDIVEWNVWSRFDSYDVATYRFFFCVLCTCFHNVSIFLSCSKFSASHAFFVMETLSW